jgi:hypothetical protein
MRVRLHRRPEGCATEVGQISTVFIDDQGMHYVVLVEGRLIHVEKSSDFSVLEDPGV